jgi:hypothetical protein
MQMLLYTHDVNANRGLAINSLWWHGAGALPTSAKTSLAKENSTNLPRPSMLQTFNEVHLKAISDLRNASLQQDWQGWMQAWTLLDQTLFADLLKRVQQGETMQVVLCGEYERHVYETLPASAWSRVLAIVGWQDLWQSNALLKSIAKRFGATALHERLVVPPRSEDM